MKPVLALLVDTEDYPADASPAVIAEVCADAVEHEFNSNGPYVQVRLLTTEAELADYQAGHIVLYRKPVRRASAADVSYRRADGTVVQRIQEELWADGAEEME